MKKGNVVCAIDVNDYDQHVIDLAGQFAECFDVSLSLLHVTLSPDPTNAAWPSYLGTFNSLNRDYQLLKTTTTKYDAVNVTHHQLVGLPVEQILGFVERHKPKLLVMGTHARQGIRRIFGSVAAQVMRKSDCPVAVLRQQQNPMEIEQEYTDRQPGWRSPQLEFNERNNDNPVEPIERSSTAPVPPSQQ